MKNFSYIGKGIIYAGKKGAAEGLRPVGNCSELAFAAEENKVSQPDFTQAGGGEANSVSRVDSVTATITMLDISPKNLALALRGSATDVAGGTSVTDERHTAYKGSLIAFAFLPDLSSADTTLTVTTDPDGTPVPAVAGTDYEVTGAGIIILDGGAIADASEIAVGYDKSQQAIIEALTESAPEFHMVFDGLNEAQSGEAVVVTVHRLKFSPTSGLNLLGEEFAEMQVEATLLSDASVTGAGLSKYFKVAMQQAA